MIRDVRGSEVFREIISPGFFMRPPVIRHAERIPPDIGAAMEHSWRQDWFAPRPVRICALEDVYVAGEGLVLTRDGDVIQPSVQQHTDEDIAQALAAIREGTAARVQGDVVLCRKPGASNYGHWLAEILPRAWLASQHWPHPLRIMVQSVGDPLRAVMLQTLARLGIAAGSCVAAGPEPVLVERLIMVDGLTAHGIYMSPLVIECLQTITASIAPAGPPRLLISRGDAPGRRFIDEPGLFAEAAARGFAIADTATMPFRDQVALFKAARRVVGAAGAALANIVFSAPGSEVLVLTPAGMPDTFYWFIAGLRGLRMLDIRCEQDGDYVPPVAWNGSLRVDAEDRHLAFSGAQLPAIPSAEATAQALSTLFDAGYYLTCNPDVAAAGVDPLTHYMQVGWREGRDPSAAFDTSRYLAENPDVAGTSFSPLSHYIQHGMAEGRPAHPVP